MGKNKGAKGKINPVFRVAGGKAAKAKGKLKAQPVSTNLKKLGSAKKEQVEQLDQQLVKVQHNLKQKPEKPATDKKKKSRPGEAKTPANVDEAVANISKL